LEGLSLSGQVDFVHIINPGNMRSNPPVSDWQYAFGLSYSL